MTRAKKSRGDAFSSLLGALPAAGDGGGQLVPLAQIQTRPNQPRRHFDADALASLTESVRAQGVLQPVLVRAAPGGYELIAGERRLRAARAAGLDAIPAVVRAVADEDVLFMAALENLQRQDLNPLDEVEATVTIVARELGVPESEVVPLLHAQRRAPDPETTALLERVFAQLGRGGWQSFAANKAGVLKYPSDLLELLRAGQLEYTRAAALARVKDDRARRALASRAVEDNLGVREIAALARPAAAGPTPYQRVRRLLDPRRIQRLGERDQVRVDKLLRELEELLSKGETKRS